MEITGLCFLKHKMRLESERILHTYVYDNWFVELP